MPVTVRGGVPITRLLVRTSSSTLTATSRRMSTHGPGACRVHGEREVHDGVLVDGLAGRRRLLHDAAVASELDAQADRRKHPDRLAQPAPRHVRHDAGPGP